MFEDGRKPVVIQVHPMLLEEFKFLKINLEEKLGYKIYGGMPIVSKVIALKLKEERINKKLKIEFSYSKVKGEKKIKLKI